MAKFLAILKSLHSDEQQALAIAKGAAPLIALAGPYGVQINAAVEAISTLDALIP